MQIAVLRENKFIASFAVTFAAHVVRSPWAKELKLNSTTRTRTRTFLAAKRTRTDPTEFRRKKVRVRVRVRVVECSYYRT